MVEAMDGAALEAMPPEVDFMREVRHGRCFLVLLPLLLALPLLWLWLWL